MSSPELARARLRVADLPSPPVLVTAEDVVRGKPDPEGYRTVARRLVVPREDTVVIEDVPIGIEAARAAGADAIVGIGRRALGAGADVVVPDLRPLRWTADGLEVGPSSGGGGSVMQSDAEESPIGVHASAWVPGWSGPECE
jgi:sugar-phosphatase